MIHPTVKCADPECEGDLKQEEKSRIEGGRPLPYRYHYCVNCGSIHGLDEDLKWNAEQMRKFYGEVAESMTWLQRWALLKAKAWCHTVNIFYCVMFPNPETWWLRPTVITDLEGKVLSITAQDSNQRVIRRFWE
jgi:hypothetical protein